VGRRLSRSLSFDFWLKVVQFYGQQLSFEPGQHAPAEQTVLIALQSPAKRVQAARGAIFNLCTREKS